ncbi:hypothetical protein OsJ_24836 [Oryza sativa Japonica Group]|uniref:Protein kinase domain-containing protein n=1 Tax=Oryza sativa subsp. japonica TaxID=39947 RepID=A3BLE9_ORYSJ|nr:hypothetical protein OsJ_24836 [Oryza sativa Japonica Group]
MADSHHCCWFLLLLLLLAAWCVRGEAEVANGGHQDLPPLLSFKSYNPAAAALESWVGGDPCSGAWIGVRCSRGRVVGVFLDNASLVGGLAPLLGLARLGVLAVRRNSLSGRLPPLDNSTSPRLRHLLVSHNQLTGGLRVSLPSLVTLRAEHNGFHGDLRALSVPMVRSFNVSRNMLDGEISGDLSRFPSSSFGGNLGLCGLPLPRCVHAYNALGDSVGQSPSAAMEEASSGGSNGGLSKLSVTALMATGIGNAALMVISVAISVAMFVYMRRKLRSWKGASDAALSFEEEDKVRNREEKGQKSNGGGLVCFDGGEELRLESLLKASAEVLGKGVSGSTYKAVLEDGIVVAVKRLSALQFPGRSKAFDRHMRLAGRLRHRHVVSLRGYCNSNGERLLVYDYLPNGSLQRRRRREEPGLGGEEGHPVRRGAGAELHPHVPGEAGAGAREREAVQHPPGRARRGVRLRVRVMRYAANIQQSIPQPPRCPPGLFLDRAAAAAGGGGWHGYAAPELASGASAAGARATQESDVYSFGMVLLEVVTADNAGDGNGGGGGDGGEDETMGWVKIGMLCTAEAPEERPRMAQVLAMMGEFM